MVAKVKDTLFYESVPINFKEIDFLTLRKNVSR